MEEASEVCPSSDSLQLGEAGMFRTWDARRKGASCVQTFADGSGGAKSGTGLGHKWSWPLGAWVLLES